MSDKVDCPLCKGLGVVRGRDGDPNVYECPYCDGWAVTTPERAAQCREDMEREAASHA